MCRASWDVLRRPQRQIQTGADGGTSAHVDPEYYLHDVQKPRASVWDAILADRDEDCGRPIQRTRRLETIVSASRKRGRTRRPVCSSQPQIKRIGTKNRGTYRCRDEQGLKLVCKGGKEALGSEVESQGEQDGVHGEQAEIEEEKSEADPGHPRGTVRDWGGKSAD